MGRIPCCERDSVKKGQWTPEEDNKLSSYIAQHGTRNWRLIPKYAGLERCGKSCRLRWTNYLRPDLKHGEFSESEEQTIVNLHSIVGNRWSIIAGQLPGRTDNDVKNHWNTKLKKKLSGMGIDPVTHKPFSHLMAEIATTLPPPQVAHLAEAALGCFKDEMLHLLTKKRLHYQAQFPPTAPSYDPISTSTRSPDDEANSTPLMKLSPRRTTHESEPPLTPKPWALISLDDPSHALARASSSMFGYRFGEASFSIEEDDSPWTPRLFTGSHSPDRDPLPARAEIVHEEDTTKVLPTRDGGVFSPAMWDLSDDLLNPIV